MPLVTMQKILSESIEKKYAVGAFDVIGAIPVFAEGVLRAAEERNVPVILMVVDIVFDDPSCEHYFSYLINRCKASSVPVAIHLDHGPSFRHVMQAIHCGCTSVMLDASSKPLEENIALTKKVVEVAHACGVTVEAEIGHVAGHEGNMLEGNVVDESTYTRVEDAKYFVEQTGVDALAIAFGTVHGVYKGTPKLDLERLKAIREQLEIPIVMHGGSGLSPQQFRDAIANGVNKINFFTGINLAAADAVKALIEAKNGKVGFDSLGQAAIEGVKKVAGEHMDIFGTQPLEI